MMRGMAEPLDREHHDPVTAQRFDAVGNVADNQRVGEDGQVFAVLFERA